MVPHPLDLTMYQNRYDLETEINNVETFSSSWCNEIDQKYQWNVDSYIAATISKEKQAQTKIAFYVTWEGWTNQ